MHDRVGELLAERARLGGGAGGGIALSILLHGSIAAAVVYAAMHATAPQQVSTLNIRFASVPAIQQAGTPAPALRAPHTTPPKLKIPEPVGEAPKPVANPIPKSVPFSPFGQSTKKGSDKPPAPVPTPRTQLPTPGVATNTDIPLGATGVTGLDSDFPYTIYVERMRVLVAQHYLRPQSAASGLTSTIHFVIDRDGTIRDAKIEMTSGDGTLDRAALRAVIETSQLPPLPFGYNGTYLSVRQTFR
jgi:TonB family protein